MYLVYNPKNQKSSEYEGRPTTEELQRIKDKGFLIFDDYREIEFRIKEDEQLNNKRGRKKGYKHSSDTIEKIKNTAQQKKEFRVALKNQLKQIEDWAKILKYEYSQNGIIEILEKTIKELKNIIEIEKIGE
jgi:hypothetical protein